MRLLHLAPFLLAAVPATPIPATSNAPALPLEAFNTTVFKDPTLEETQRLPKLPSPITITTDKSEDFALESTCSNPRIRVEWDSLQDGDRQDFVNSIKCLMQKPPSGKYPSATNRYEDLVALHQAYMPNVHSNAKFLVWHRYYLWTFEDLLRTECGFSAPLPWFDETKYTGHFHDSSIFSDKWMGGLALNGNCVTDGQFANIQLHIGPGTADNTHCLQRHGDSSVTSSINTDFVNSCNSKTDYADMANCAEMGPHNTGHRGIGAVMNDVSASPGDPVFWLHHGFIDRNFYSWQNDDSSRTGYIDGSDHFGNALTLTTGINVNGIRPDVSIGNVINTMGQTLCYRYDY